MPQIEQKRHLTFNQFSEGCRLIIWGLFKKIAVADRLGIYVDSVYDNLYQHSGPTFILATVFFAFQIYCDFSAYSDIARGLGRLMGFDIMVNFRYPYFSKNIREFWQRWHISLSSWLKDYLYIPLGGNRRGELKTYRNIFITMLLGGLWHGAGWTFVVWGILHGFFISGTKLLNKFSRKDKFNKRIWPIFSIMGTFCMVLLTWVFFRARSIVEAIYILKSIALSPSGLFIGPLGSFIYALMSIVFLIVMEIRAERMDSADVLWFNSKLIKYIASYVVIFYIILFGAIKGEHFIYFQF